MLRETWARVDISRASSLAFVLDCSESAQRHWPNILGLALNLLRRVPETCQCSVYFLGDAQAYTRDNLRQDSARLYNDHCRRASVISPLLETLAEEKNIACVVLLAGNIYDLEDWVNTPIAERLVLANFENIEITDAGFLQCEPNADEIMESGPLAAQLGAPSRVEVFGTGIMPFFWDNPSYRFVDGKLVAEKITDWKGHFGILCFSENDIKATVIIPGNRKRDADLTLCSYAPGIVWQPLSHADAALFRQAIQHGKFDCPICKQQHSRQKLRCFDDPKRLLGSCVYSSIDPRSGAEFVLLRESGQTVEFSYHICKALRINEENVAVRFEGTALVYEVDHTSLSWRIGSQKFEQYQPVRDGNYAIIL